MDQCLPSSQIFPQCRMVMADALNLDRLHPTSITMYVKCFSLFLSCRWANGSTLTLLHWCQVGVDFKEFGVWLSLSDVVRLLLRLQTPIDCIPHPYHSRYEKCLCLLLCCGWAYGSTLTLLRLCRWGWILGNWGNG